MDKILLTNKEILEKLHKAEHETYEYEKYIPAKEGITYKLEGVDLDIPCNIHINELGSVSTNEFNSSNNFTVTKSQTITTPCIGVYEINLENLTPAYAPYYEDAHFMVYSTETSNGRNVTLPNEDGKLFRAISGNKVQSHLKFLVTKSVIITLFILQVIAPLNSN